jgi:hypothetical protein
MVQKRTTGTRVTVRLTAEDESALAALTAHMRPRFTLVNKSDIMRAALLEAQRVLTADR